MRTRCLCSHWLAARWGPRASDRDAVLCFFPPARRARVQPNAALLSTNSDYVTNQLQSFMPPTRGYIRDPSYRLLHCLLRISPWGIRNSVSRATWRTRRCESSTPCAWFEPRSSPRHAVDTGGSANDVGCPRRLGFRSNVRQRDLHRTPTLPWSGITSPRLVTSEFPSCLSSFPPHHALANWSMA